MKIVIGIFQNKEDVTQFYKRRIHDMSSLIEVGPFFSKKQAMSWMKELRSRIEKCETGFIPEQSRDDLKWYGFTFEE